MKTAFIVLKSPAEQDPTHLMKRFAERAESSVVLVEDGGYQAVVATAAERLSKAAAEIVVSKEDLEARGYSPSDLKVGKAAGYDDIVDCIMERTERTVTV